MSPSAKPFRFKSRLFGDQRLAFFLPRSLCARREFARRTCNCAINLNAIFTHSVQCVRWFANKLRLLSRSKKRDSRRRKEALSKGGSFGPLLPIETRHFARDGDQVPRQRSSSESGPLGKGRRNQLDTAQPSRSISFPKGRLSRALSSVHCPSVLRDLRWTRSRFWEPFRCPIGTKPLHRTLLIVP